jgi:hypothetical protein
LVYNIDHWSKTQSRQHPTRELRRDASQSGETEFRPRERDPDSFATFDGTMG